ncbi:MAG: carbohydrate ABC transporter permease [Anaerolineae bacterium]|nr:carbohydrate ABC transporter permease [Anaerolineae bacterium]
MGVSQQIREGAVSPTDASDRTVSRHRLATGFYYGVVVALLMVYLVPIFWVISSSLRINENMYRPDQWIPQPATLDHYVNLFEFLPDWGRYLFNTVSIATLSTIGTLLSCSMAGYALARLHFPGRGLLILILLLTLMVPAQATLVPVYVMFRRLGWINTLWPLIVPAFFGGAFATFFFRQFFLAIPREIEEAALVDGAGRWRIYWNIVLPMSKPALTTMGILSFVGGWNSYFGPSVFLQRQDQWVLTQGLLYLNGRYTSEWGEIMAGVVLMSLPMVVLYIVGQRYFIQGITFTGVKG